MDFVNFSCLIYPKPEGRKARKTNKIKLFFASGDTARVDKILDAVREDIKSRTKAAEDAAASSTAAQ